MLLFCLVDQELTTDQLLLFNRDFDCGVAWNKQSSFFKLNTPEGFEYVDLHWRYKKIYKMYE